ncbi:Multidrug resistance-associated protein 4 [Acromyrmex echinatior]|uniref:Multidrug resistance-associated protein 4 n=1 Tax=Acromyrmex echinatior TaxID=103372 RepID=F4X5L5_ACREC|nr:Multidrug resistance-associated protein 4 [Acromyrmex echinatior]
MVPILQSWIIKYFISDPNAKYKTSTNEVMIYITFLIITNVITIMLLHHSVMQSLHVGMRIRIACSSLSEVSLIFTGFFADGRSEHETLLGTPQLQFKSQKPKEESNAKNQIDSTSREMGVSFSPNIKDYLTFQYMAGKYNFLGNLSIGYFTNNPNLRISYASQELWLFGGTVRDDILFGRSYNKARYMQFFFDQLANVSGSCVHLDKGFLQRDMTTVGDRSVSLSGGQRVNLVREVYRQADILLDDPLSAMNTRVARHLYRKCITEYLHGKTRILVTNQLQFLKRADHIVVLDH